MSTQKPIKLAMMSCNHGHSRGYYQAFCSHPDFEPVAYSIRPDYRDRLFLEKLPADVPCYEDDETMLNAKLSPYKVTVTRYPAAEVAAEVEQAVKLQEELAADAKKKLREAKKAQIREKIVKKGEEIREEFNKLYSK